MTSNAVALLVLFGVTNAVYHCADDGRPQPPDVIWDGGAYVTTWRAGTSIYVRRKERTRVFRHASTWLEPTIAMTSEGFLVMANRKGRDIDWEPIAIPLDHSTRARRPVRLYGLLSADRQCRARRTAGEPVAAAFLSYMPRTTWIEFHAIDRRGEQLGVWTFATTWRQLDCVVASGNGDLVMATRDAQTITLTFFDAAEHDYHSHVIEGVSQDLDWQISLVATPDHQWAVLYRDGDAALRVARFDRAGIVDSVAVPFETTATAELGATARGVFVAWVDGTALHVRGLGRGDAHRARVPRGAAIAAIGHDSECAVAVRAPGADDVTLARFPNCM